MENKPIKYNYLPYYLKTIQENSIGFKPVRGATGLGKTYGLIQAVKQSNKENENLKFIYTTNRHALIKEVKNDLEKEGIKCVYLRSDKEVLIDLVNEKGNKNLLKEILFDLVESNFFEYDINLKNDAQIKKRIEQTLKNIEAGQNFVRQNGRDDDESIQGFVDDQLVSLMRLLKNQIYLHKRKSKTKHKEWLQNPTIWKLFPYIEFENNPNSVVLLATIQKLSYGFFDGHRKRKLPSLKKNIIFLDEFDFLESEILNVLVQEIPLQNPLEFVKIFYERYNLIKEKNFFNEPPLIKLKDGLDKAFKELEKTIKEKKINFPKLTDFTYFDLNYSNKEKEIVLFQNKDTVFSEPFYLKQTKLSWEISKKNYKNTIKPLDLFTAIKKCIKQLLDTFSRTMQEQEKEVNYIIDKIWNVKNDNVQGSNQNYITSTSLFKNIQVASVEVNKNHFDYLYGFNIIKLSRNKEFDPLNAELEQIEIPTSPEAIIRKLSYENLVFALSATSDIPRVVKCFDEKWLKEHTPFIEPSVDDKKLLLDMKQEKDDIRKTTIEFAQNKPIDKLNKISKVLEEIKNQTPFFSDQNTDTNETTKDNRVGRIRKIIGCLDWILNKSNNRSHLIFMTTFNHFKQLLDNNDTEHLEDIYRQDLQNIWQIEEIPQENKEANKKIKAFKMSWQEKTCTIIFLNSKIAKQIEEYGKEFYNKIMSNTDVDKVILITQYATASNGVNLGFEDSEGIKRDFESIHLLEGNYYWITNKNDLSSEKEKFWYLWKIYEKREIGISSFRHFLGQSKGNGINSRYKKTQDHILNAMALFHQALGRVERQRQYEQPIIEITLSTDVVEIFKSFLSEEYQEINEIKEKLPYTATTITQLYDRLKEYLKIEEIKLLTQETQNITQENKNSKDIIDLILNELEQIKKGNYVQNEKLAEEIISLWKKIRLAVLEQDYQAEINLSKELSKILKIRNKENILYFSEWFTFSTSYFQENDKLLLTTPTADQQGYEIYREKNISISNKREWNLDLPYSQIKQNAILSKRFEKEGYPTFFQRNENSDKQFVFTPRVEQAILKGAIGEEAIRILLEERDIYMEDIDQTDKILFEVADMKMQDLPIYIDAKNFSPVTINNFVLYDAEYDIDKTFDPEKVIKKAQTKIKKIQKITEDKNAKFVFINLVAANYKNLYYDINLKRVESFEKCTIAIIPSTLNYDNPNQIDEVFLHFVDCIFTELSKI